MPIFFCGLAFTALWVLARLKVFGQRNGVFFSISVIAMLGALAALVEQGWNHFSNRSEPRVSTSVQSQAAISAPQSPDIPALIDALRLETPDQNLPRVRAIRDLTTAIGDKTYRIRRGDIFLFADQKAGEITISAGEFLARVPESAMEILAMRGSASSPAGKPADNGKSALEKQEEAKLTQRAQQEAARRYPALGRAGSEENKVFLEAYNELKSRHSDLLDDPEWPLELAQTLAQRLGWKERGVVEDTPPVVETNIAPGTKVLAEPPAPPAAEPEPATSDSDIPPPPKTPRQ